MFARLARALGLVIVGSISGLPTTTIAAPQQQTIVLMRHGEKPPEGLGQLDCQGLNRALALPPILKRKFGIPDYIFAPDPRQQVLDHENLYYYIRPLATIEEPKQTLPAVKRRIAKILLAVRDRGQKAE
jgi:hypothetical protein